MVAGETFGATTVLVLSGRTKRRDLKTLGVTPRFVKKELLEAARWLTEKKS